MPSWRRRGDPFGSLSRDGRWLVLGYWIDTKSNDLWLVDFDRFLKSGKIDKMVVTVGVDGQATRHRRRRHTVHPHDEGRAHGDASSPRAPRSRSRRSWRDVVPERPDAIIDAVSFGKGVIAVTYLKNASNVVEVFDLTGKSLGVVNQPGIGAAGVSAEIDRTEALSDVHELQLSDDDLSRRSGEAAGGAGALGAARRAGRSGDRGGRAGLVPVEGRHQDQHVPGPQEGPARNGRHADHAHRLRRLQHQRDAGVFGHAVSVDRGRRPLRRAEPARRRRVRRRVARGRHARQEAERLRRFHRRGRVADREPLHELAAAGDHAARRTAGC